MVMALIRIINTSGAVTLLYDVKFSGGYLPDIIIFIKALENTLLDNSIERKKMENAKNDWLAGVSHDLKTPLSYMNGYSSLIFNESYNFSEEEIKTYIKEIYSKGIYIGKLINDLNFNFSIDASGNLHLNHIRCNIFHDAKQEIEPVTYPLHRPVKYIRV